MERSLSTPNAPAAEQRPSSSLSTRFLSGRGLTVALVLAVIAVSAIGWWRFLLPDFPYSYDGDLHIPRVLQMEHELRSGQFPVRWGGEQAWGYGYPTFNYYYPLPYYLAAVLHMAGVPVTTAIETLLIASMILGTVFMALWVRAIWGPLGGFIAASLYTLSPALLQAAYLVMTIGEVMVIGLLPLVCWSLHRTLRTGVYRTPVNILAPIAVAAMILSHNFLGATGLALVGAYGLGLSIAHRRSQPLIHAVVVVMLGLGLSAFFWLPGYVELPYIQPSGGGVRFPPQAELIDMGLGPRTERQSDLVIDSHTRDTLGFSNVAAVIVAVAAMLLFARVMTREQRMHLAFAFVAFGVVAFLLITPGREDIWRMLPLLKQAQYSARLLPIVALPAALAAGSAVAWTWSRPLVVVLLVGSAIIYGAAFGRPTLTQRGDDIYFLSDTPMLFGTADWDHTVLPRGARADIVAPKEDPRPSLRPAGGRVIAFEKTSTSARVTVDLPEPATLNLPIYDFPGWTAWLDGSPVEHGKVSTSGTVPAPQAHWTEPETMDGAIAVPVPAGQHEVVVRFTDTTVRRAGNYVSLASIAVLLITGVGLLIRPRRGSVG
jgi:hypothetical protein